MAKNIKAGGAAVEISAIDKTEAGLRAASASLKKYGTKVAGIGAAIAGAGAAVLGPLVGMAKSFADAGGALNKMSTQTGIAVEQLSALKFATGQVGVDFDDAEGAIEEFNIRMGETIQDGVGPMSEAFKKLGLDAQQLADMPLAEQMGMVGDALNKLDNRADRQFLADEIFGGDAFRLMPLLNQGAEGISALTAEADKLGVVMSSGAAKDAAAFNAAMAKMKAVLTGTKNVIGSAVAPAITWLVETFVSASQGVRDFIRENKSLFTAIAGGAAAVVAIGTAIVGLGAAMSLAGVALGGMASAIAFLISPIGLAIGGFAALAIAIFKYTDWAGDALAWLGDRFGPLVETVKGAVTAILEAFRTGDLTKAWALIVDTMELIWLDLTNGIRGYWDDAMNLVVDASTWMTEQVGSLFQALGDFLRNLLDKYKSYYNTVFNFVTEKIGEAGGVRTLGGPVDAFGGGAVDNTLSNAISGIKEFGGALKDTAIGQREASREARAAAARERDERLGELRTSLAGEAEAAKKAREEREALEAPEDLKKPEFELGSAGGGEKTAGTFSAFAAGLLGATSPQQKMVQGIEAIARNTAEANKLMKKPKPATLG